MGLKLEPNVIDRYQVRDSRTNNIPFRLDHGSIKSIHPWFRMHVTLNGEKCTNWEYMDSFGVRLAEDYMINQTESNYTNFYDPELLEYPGWHRDHVTMHYRSIIEEKGFLFEDGLFERYESFGVTWNDTFCRKIKEGGQSGCFVKRKVQSDLIADFQNPENNCSA